jgi:hypothetical protein
LRVEGAIICYLDEKWFYLFSRRRHAKHLPRAEFEEEGVDRIRVRHVISRAHPVKTMYMGVLTEPVAERNFNGMLSLKRLSTQQQLQRGTYRYRFHIDYDINQQILNGEWRMLHDDVTYTIAELSQLIVDHYELGEDIAETLCFRYATHVGDDRRREYRTLLENDTIENKMFINEHGNEQELTINFVEISSYLPAGSIVEKEVTCDSAFMLANLPIIAAEIREAMPWVPNEQAVYLVMDNVGGHGT